MKEDWYLPPHILQLWGSIEFDVQLLHRDQQLAGPKHTQNPKVARDWQRSFWRLVMDWSILWGCLPSCLHCLNSFNSPAQNLKHVWLFMQVQKECWLGPDRLAREPFLCATWVQRWARVKIDNKAKVFSTEHRWFELGTIYLDRNSKKFTVYELHLHPPFHQDWDAMHNYAPWALHQLLRDHQIGVVFIGAVSLLYLALQYWM